MRISDWSSDVCSSDLFGGFLDATLVLFGQALLLGQVAQPRFLELAQALGALLVTRTRGLFGRGVGVGLARLAPGDLLAHHDVDRGAVLAAADGEFLRAAAAARVLLRKSEESGVGE